MFILWQCLWPSRPIVQRSVDYWVLSVVFKVVLQHSGLNIQKWPPRRSSHQYLPKHMTNVNDHVWIRNQSRNLHLMHRPHQSYAGFYWQGRQQSVLVSASPCNGFSLLLEVSWSESASVDALARYQDTMFLIVPSKKCSGIWSSLARVQPWKKHWMSALLFYLIGISATQWNHLFTNGNWANEGWLMHSTSNHICPNSLSTETQHHVISALKKEI